MKFRVRRKPTIKKTSSTRHYPTFGSIPERYLKKASPENMAVLKGFGVRVPDIAAIFKMNPSSVQKILNAEKTKKRKAA